MPSFKSQMLNFVLRNRNLLKFSLKRETWDEHTSIQEFRDLCEAGARKMKIPEGIEIAPARIDGLPAGLAAEWIRPAGCAQNPGAIFFTHGGGYVSGSCADHRGYVAKLVAGSGVPALLYEYRLAPEHPYPAALDDTLTAYRWLLAQGFDPAHIVIMGESAGGGLALATLLALRDQGLPLPAAGMAMSPWTDLKFTGESHRTRVKVAIDPIGMSRVCSRYYYGDSDPGLPWISPLYGDLHGLPPLLMTVGTDEMMFDDATRFAEKAAQAGVPVTLKVGDRQVHCYPFFAPAFPEATQALDEICAFIKRSVQQPVAVG